MNSSQRRFLFIALLVLVGCAPAWSQSVDNPADNKKHPDANHVPAKVQPEQPSKKATSLLSATDSAVFPTREKDSKPDPQGGKPAESGRPANRQETPAAASQASLVQKIRHWTTTDRTRVVIQMDREARYKNARLSNPDRIYFDVSDASLSHNLLNKTFPVGNEFLKRIRVGQNRSDTVRVVLDVAKIGDFSIFELHDPFRIVIDIHAGKTAYPKTVEPRSAEGPPGSTPPDTVKPEPVSAREVGKPGRDERKAPVVETAQSPATRTETRTNAELPGIEPGPGRTNRRQLRRARVAKSKSSCLRQNLPRPKGPKAPPGKDSLRCTAS